ncbi:uncharacterized protein LOC110706426 [Chenopodium quinoa]|uniref:uncharacterized protein LOC110706426 n=1 Tax=Chenopodium quinoa TaxID=63459 RepID=UPI000B774A18|nr:uncharacterized protein LOC110706426 [Chenopodium quinoa]
MEGLIPMVFKAIKKNKSSRRRYKCLSMGAAPMPKTQHIIDLCCQGDHHEENVKVDVPSSEITHGEIDVTRNGHRRFGSAIEFGVNYEYKFNHMANDFGRTSSSGRKQIIQRYDNNNNNGYENYKLFSCFTGAIYS